MVFNQSQQAVQSAQSAQQQALSAQDRILIEALLADSGILPAVGGGGQSPPITPAPPPGPPPPPTPAPAPSTPPINPIVRLAMTTVKPGDLITAGFMNTLVDALFALDERLSKLEVPSQSPAPSPPPPPPPGPPPPPPPQGPQGGSLETEAPATFEAESARSSGNLEPVIATAIATPTKGSGLRINVAGDNIEEGMVEEVRLGKTKFARAKLKFDEAGVSFTTTTAVLQGAKNRLTVVTVLGEDDATVTTAGKAPA